MAEEDTVSIRNAVRLDKLVFYKCVSFMKQTVNEDLKHCNVSREFADAVQSIHKKMSISLEFYQDQRHYFWLVLHKYKFRGRMEYENYFPVAILKNVLNHFKRIKTLDLSLSNLRCFGERLPLEFLPTILAAGLTKLNKLILMKNLEYFREPTILLQQFAPILKDVRIDVSDEATTDTEATMEKFFDALALCTNLRSLRFDDIKETFVDHLTNCLRLLKIKRFQADDHCDLFSQEQIIEILKANTSLRIFTIGQQTGSLELFSCPAILPLLSHLQTVGVILYHRPLYEEKTKRALLEVLQSLGSGGGTLVVQNIFRSRGIVPRVFGPKKISDVPVLREHLLQSLDFLSEVFTATGKSIKLTLIIGFPRFHEKDIEATLDILLKTPGDDYKAAIVAVREWETTTILVEKGQVSLTLVLSYEGWRVNLCR